MKSPRERIWGRIMRNINCKARTEEIEPTHETGKLVVYDFSPNGKNIYFFFPQKRSTSGW